MGSGGRSPPGGDDRRSRGRLSRAALGWSMFDVGRFPVLMLILVFIFVPYFATSVAPDPVSGQALVARFSLIAGIIAAVTAPLLGAAVDRLGACKPWLAGCIVVIAVATAALWYVRPGPLGVPIAAAVALLAVVSLFMTYGEVLGNAMLAALPEARERARASGFALAAGNGLSLILMIGLLWGFLLPGTTESGFVPADPLFGLRRDTFEPVRIVAPIAALGLLIASMPFLRLARDRPATPGRIGDAVAGGVRDIIGVVRNIGNRRDPALYLLARTVFQDASTAVMQLIGVYAAGTMRWRTPEMTAFGVVCVVAGIFGGLMAERMDNRLGPKRALQISILTSALCLFLELGTGPTRIFYLWSFQPADVPVPWHAPVFQSLPEILFLTCAGLSSAAQVAALSSSRMLLTSLLRRDEVATWFGLAALTGTATAWVGPLMVGIFTTVFVSQQAGFIPLVVMLILGAGMLSFIKGGNAPVAEPVL